MEDILKDLMIAIIGDGINFFDSFLSDYTNFVFLPEENLPVALNVSGLFNVIQKYAILMIVTKFLLKMFSIYVGWTDGDSLSNPFQVLVYFIRAIAVAVSFEDIYNFMVRLTKEIINEILSVLTVTDESLSDMVTNNYDLNNLGIFTLGAFLIFLVFLFLIKFQFIKRGLETLVLRVGAPIASIGLINSDTGAFSPYIKLFIQNMLTAIVQVAMFKISMVIFATGHIFWGLASISMTLSTPKFLAQYMLQVHGLPINGTTQFARATSSVVGKVRSVKKV